jgi:hypothetical protein
MTKTAPCTQHNDTQTNSTECNDTKINDNVSNVRTVHLSVTEQCNMLSSD